MGQVCGGAPRDQSCARRERWDRLGFRAAARRGSGCRRSYARSGPLPLPPRGQGRGRSHLFTQKGTLFTRLMSLLGLRGTGPALAAASWRRRKALVGEAFGVPQRGTAYQPRVKPWGMAHNRCVLKERRIHPGALTCFAVAEYRGWRWGSGCRRSYARSGPLPLPPRGQGRGRSHLFTQKGTLFTILMSLLGLRGICPAAASWRPKG